MGRAVQWCPAWLSTRGRLRQGSGRLQRKSSKSRTFCGLATPRQCTTRPPPSSNPGHAHHACVCRGGVGVSPSDDCPKTPCCFELTTTRRPWTKRVTAAARACTKSPTVKGPKAMEMPAAHSATTSVACDREAPTTKLGRSSATPAVATKLSATHTSAAGRGTASK